ncbi:hypothetical protein CR513_19373, partial [Mucuna pruriens]
MFFVKTFQKGLKAAQFSDSLALRRPGSMEEDLANRIQVEREEPSFPSKGNQGPSRKGNPEQGGNHKIELEIIQFTLLRVARS